MQNVSAVDEVLSRQLGLETPCFVAQLLPQLMDLVRASRRLPLGEEHAIRRGSRDFLQASRELGDRSLRAAHRTLRFVDPNGVDAESTAEELKNFNLVIDSIDTVLEKADSCIKEALQGDGAPAADGEAPPEDAAGGGGAAPSLERRVGGFSGAPLGKSSIAKPQVRWRQLVDNDRTLFVPRLVVKHNARTPLNPRIVEAQRKVGLRAGGARGAASGLAAQQSSPRASAEPTALQTHLDALGVDREGAAGGAAAELPHPYDDELRQLTWHSSTLKPVEAQRYLRLEDTPLVWVRTDAELRQMVDEIKATCAGSEIAVDVEHHDFRSYRGFVCLVQVSTRQKDFLIDPFNIFEDMHILNEIFTDPRIVKVLHGADRDVIWLQRDFSVYLVNMFDTGLATRALRLQGGFSLANLVLQHCGVKLDKKYQTADWRERPLSAEMAQYARLDTHYLLYCYDCVRNSLLLQQSAGSANTGSTAGLKATEEGVQALRTVWEKSAELARTRYTEAPFDAANSAMRLSERFGMKQKPLDSRQFGVLRGLLGWRDRLSRTLDESWNFVAPDACLWRVALALPTSASRLRSTCNPLPPTLQQRAQEIVEIVNKCEDAGAAATGAAAAAAVASPAFRAAAPPPIAAGLASSTSSLAGASGTGARLVAEATPSAARRNWPSRTCSSMRPHVRVSAGSHGALFNGASKHPQHQRVAATLASMFDSESDDDEEEVAKDKAQKITSNLAFAAAAPGAPPPAPVPPAAPAAAPMPTPMPAPAQQAGGTYEMPQAVGRKKKKRKASAAAGGIDVTSLGKQVAAEAAKASALGGSGTNLEVEAELFRAALVNAAAANASAPSTAVRRVGATASATAAPPAAAAAAAASPVAAATVAAAVLPAAAAAGVPTTLEGVVAVGTPRPKKKRKRVEAAEAAASAPAPALAVEDPYAVASAEAAVTDDPYALLAAEPSQAADAAAAAQPRKNKKKKVVVSAPVQDPYL